MAAAEADAAPAPVLRVVAGLAKADHAETNPEGEVLLVDRLSCSLVEKGGQVRFAAGSRLRAPTSAQREGQEGDQHAAGHEGRRADGRVLRFHGGTS